MSHLDFPQTYCLAAVARRDVTPPVGIYHRMWGAARHDRSTGIHRPLTATALALHADGMYGAANDTQPMLVVVSLDHCLLWTAEMDALHASVCRSTGLNSDQLHIAMSHTHAAGLMDPARRDLPGGDMIAPYLDLLAERIVEAADEALAALRPVRIVYGTGRCSLAAHRDFWDADNKLFACGYNPTGPTDDTVLVARMTDEHSQSVATLVNYACHPTTLAWDNTLISPDYVGAMRELIESATAAPCIFLQGASGDLGPRDGYVGDVAIADRNGRELGYAALAALESLPQAGLRFEYTGPIISGATIGTWEYRALAPDELRRKYRWQSAPLNIEMPYRPDLPTVEETRVQMASAEREEQEALLAGEAARAGDCRAMAERMRRQLSRLASLPPGSSLRVRASAHRLGDAFWVFIAGEYYNLLQRSLRARFPDRPIILSTVTDGWPPGYVPTADTYGRGIYQESIAVVAPGSLEELIDQLAERLVACGS